MVKLQGALHPKAEGTKAGGSGSQGPGAREALQSQGSAAAGAPRRMMRPGLQVSEKKLEPETFQGKSHCCYGAAGNRMQTAKSKALFSSSPTAFPFGIPDWQSLTRNQLAMKKCGLLSPSGIKHCIEG